MPATKPKLIPAEQEAIRKLVNEQLRARNEPGRVANCTDRACSLHGEPHFHIVPAKMIPNLENKK